MSTHCWSIHCWSTRLPAGLAGTVDACEQVSEEDEESSSEVQNSSHFLLLFSLGTDGATGEVINKTSGFGLSKMLSVMLTGDAEVDLAYAAVTVLMASFSHSSMVRWRTT